MFKVSRLLPWNFYMTFISKLLKRVLMQQKPRNSSENASKRTAIPRHSFMLWRRRCKQHSELESTQSRALATRFTVDTELPWPELPGVMRVTPARVTLEVVGGPTLGGPLFCRQFLFFMHFLKINLLFYISYWLRLRLIICGDSESNPGPGSNRSF